MQPHFKEYLHFHYFHSNKFKLEDFKIRLPKRRQTLLPSFFRSFLKAKMLQPQSYLLTNKQLLPISGSYLFCNITKKNSCRIWQEIKTTNLQTMIIQNLKYDFFEKPGLISHLFLALKNILGIKMKSGCPT